MRVSLLSIISYEHVYISFNRLNYAKHPLGIILGTPLSKMLTGETRVERERVEREGREEQDFNTCLALPCHW